MYCMKIHRVPPNERCAGENRLGLKIRRCSFLPLNYNNEENFIMREELFFHH